MRRISADYVFPVSSPPIKDGVVEVDEKGVIVSVSLPRAPSGGGHAPEKYEGVIIPGFVNAHCHLELSHLKGQVSEGKGLTGFISELVPKRGTFPDEQIKKAVEHAEAEMIRNGIVAVGDISNSDHSFEQKGKGNLIYHTFLEVFDLAADKAKEKFLEGKLLSTKLDKLPNSITPHAPYSVSGQLMELIDNLKQPILSIHNQESAAENELFMFGTGPLAEMMLKSGVDVDAKRRAKKSLLFTLGSLIETQKVLLVHNTYTSAEDINLLNAYLSGSEVEATFCLCPRANLYIEGRLPDISLFMKAGIKLAIGTDSYASNWSLSILDEMKAIVKLYPQIPFETMMAWATKNGAEALGVEKELGTLEKGKRPGLNLITGLSSDGQQLTQTAELRRIV